MDLYIYEGVSDRKQRAGSDLLVQRCLAMYEDRTSPADGGASPDSEAVIARTANGKPYFTNRSVHFSVSHSGQLWICAMSAHNVGADIQESRRADHEKLAGRFFTAEEKEYCRLWGAEGFYRIWVRKEALVKYLGSTLGSCISTYSIAAAGSLLDVIQTEDGDVQMKEIEISPEIKCAVAAEETEDICIMTLN